jgi:hypothetical protein
MKDLGADVLLNNDFTQQTSGGAGQSAPVQPAPLSFEGITSIGQSLITANSSAAARIAISAAASGNNNDITSLSALTLVVINGLNIIGYTESVSAPSTTDYPNEHDFGVHQDTSGPTWYVAFNTDGSTVVSVQLT